jgi:hypothetical protein
LARKGLKAVEQGRSITLIPPQIGEYKDPSVEKCAEIVGHTAAATQAFADEIARLSDLLAKQQAELSTVLQHEGNASSGSDYDNWRAAHADLQSTMSVTKKDLINAVAEQRDYVVRLGQYCLDQQR